MFRGLGGKTVLITGANEGIGFQTALSLAARNARVVMTDKNDLTESKRRIIERTNNSNVSVKFSDFASLTHVRCLAEEVKEEETRLDVLINNVGVYCLGKDRTADGLQATMQVNHFAPFLFTHLLVDLLAKSAPSRVIFVSSIGAFFHKLTAENINNAEVSCCDALSSLLVYYNSKLCNIIAANGFARRLEKFQITSNSLHPGMTATGFLFRNPPSWVLQAPELGARTSIFLSTENGLEQTTGKFFVDMKPHQQPGAAVDLEFCEKIWEVSEFFAGLKTDERL